MDLSQTSQNTAAMNFTENQQGSAILGKLRLQKDSGRFCDVVFHVKDQQYMAHRNVLAACSPYFDSMLKMNKVAKEHMTVACDSSGIFEVLLDYVYTGKVVIDGTTVSELLRLANHFMINKLKEHCSEYMERNINVTNCFSIKEQATKCGCTALAQTSEYFIVTNISEIIQQQEVIEFTSSQLENLLSFKKAFELTEDQKFWIIIRWLKYKTEEREKDCRAILGYIFWSHVNLDLVYVAIKTDDLFSTSERCLFDLLSVLEENSLLVGEYTDILEQLRPNISKLQMEHTNAMIQSAVTAAIGELHNSFATNKGPKSEIENDEFLQDDGKIEPQDDSNYVKVTSRIEEEEEGNDGGFIVGDDGDDTTENESITMPKIDPEMIDSESMYQPPAPVITVRPGRGRHKRKGIPVKVRINKKKIKPLKIDKVRLIIPKLPKKRGRPPKKFYSDQLKQEDQDDNSNHTASLPMEENAETSEMMDHFEEECFEEDYSSDEDYMEDSDTDPTVKMTLDGSKKRRGRKRKERVKCDKCLYVATSEMRLDQHMKTAHKDDTTYSCSLCEFKCHWNREFYRHMKSHFSGPPYKCDFQECDYICDRIQPLLYHRMIHTDERPFQCTICNMKFRTKNNLTTHLRCHTGKMTDIILLHKHTEFSVPRI